MIEDPYKVLGLEADASADDIKKAYRLMAKKYHPDLHPDDPNITEKMNEINEAYDMLTNPGKYAVKRAQEEPQEQQASWEAVQEQPQSNEAGQLTISRPVVQPDDSPEIQQVVTFINRNQFEEAVQALTAIPSAGRTARWYYLSALANQMLGNYILATDQMQKAAQMEPQNQTYLQVLMQFQKAGQIYEKKRGGIPYGMILIAMMFLGYFLGKVFAGN